jgi:hypothetical protein
MPISGGLPELLLASPRSGAGHFPGELGDRPNSRGGRVAPEWNREIGQHQGPGATTGDDIVTTLTGGTRVKKGYYFEMRSWALEPVACDGEPLPGTAAHIYFHVPLLLALLLAPLMGAAFVMFLPCVGFYLVLQAAFLPVARLFRRSATEMAATVQPGWQPGRAHLTGRAGEKQEPAGEAPGTAEDGLASVEREIEQKRQRER